MHELMCHICGHVVKHRDYVAAREAMKIHHVHKHREGHSSFGHIGGY